MIVSEPNGSKYEPSTLFCPPLKGILFAMIPVAKDVNGGPTAKVSVMVEVK